MRRLSAKHVLAAAAVGALLTAGIAVASTSTYPVLRGNWEVGPNAGDSSVTLAAGAAFGREARWHVGSGDIDIVGKYWKAALGRQSVDLNGTQAGSIYRDLKTRPGQKYILSFKISGNPDCAPATKRLAVYWDGQFLGNRTSEIAGKSLSDMGYINRNFNVTASDHSARLEFKSLTAGACGPVIDDVAVYKKS